MASVVDSFKESFSDRLSFLKFIVLTIPVYYSYQVYMQSKGDLTGFFWLAGIVLFFLFGFLIKVTNNVSNEKTYVLPSLNPVYLASSAFKGIVAVGPICLVSVLLANYLCSIINIIPWLDITLRVLIWGITASIIITPFLMFAFKENIADSFNIKVFAEKAGDLIFIILFFIIKLLVINIVTVGFIGYTLLILFGYGPIFDFFVSLALVFNIAVIGHYLGQVYCETIGYEKPVE